MFRLAGLQLLLLSLANGELSSHLLRGAQSYADVRSEDPTALRLPRMSQESEITKVNNARRQREEVVIHRRRGGIRWNDVGARREEAAAHETESDLDKDEETVVVFSPGDREGETTMEGEKVEVKKDEDVEGKPKSKTEDLQDPDPNALPVEDESIVFSKTKDSESTSHWGALSISLIAVSGIIILVVVVLLINDHRDKSSSWVEPIDSEPIDSDQDKTSDGTSTEGDSSEEEDDSWADETPWFQGLKSDESSLLSYVNSIKAAKALLCGGNDKEKDVQRNKKHHTDHVKPSDGTTTKRNLPSSKNRSWTDEIPSEQGPSSDESSLVSYVNSRRAAKALLYDKEKDAVQRNKKLRTNQVKPSDVATAKINLASSEIGSWTDEIQCEQGPSSDESSLVCYVNSIRAAKALRCGGNDKERGTDQQFEKRHRLAKRLVNAIMESNDNDVTVDSDQDIISLDSRKLRYESDDCQKLTYEI